MNNEHPVYTLLHYVLMLCVIFGTIAVLEGIIGTVPLWAGLLLALGFGVAYPRLTRWLGIAPKRWE